MTYLDFVEILPSLKRNHIVCRDTSYWLISWICSSVKCKGCLSWGNLQEISFSEIK